MIFELTLTCKCEYKSYYRLFIVYKELPSLVRNFACYIIHMCKTESKRNVSIRDLYKKSFVAKI